MADVRFGVNPGAADIWFGRQDASSGPLTTEDLAHSHGLTEPAMMVLPMITSVVPATPQEGQAGVLVNMVNGGTAQGQIRYDGVPCTITAWSASQATVTMPVVSNPGSTTPLNQFRDLVVERDDAQLSPAFPLQLTTQTGRVLVQSAANDTGQQSVVDADSVVLGQDLLHYQITAGDISDLSQIAKAVPNGMADNTVLRLNVWDPVAGSWGTYGNKTFQLSSELITADGLDHIQQLGEVTLQVRRAITPDPVTHVAHGLGTPALALPTEDLAHAQGLGEVTLAVTRAISPEPLDHAHELGEVFVFNVASLQPLAVGHGQTLSEPSLQVKTNVSVVGLSNDHSITEPALTVTRQIGIDSVAHGQAIGTPTVGRLVISPEGVTHGHGISEPNITFTREALEFRDLATEAQNVVMFNLGEATIIDPDGAATEVRGVWDFESETPGAGLGFEANSITLDLHNDSGRLMRGAEVVRKADGLRYRTKEIQSSDFNYTTYVLERV